LFFYIWLGTSIFFGFFGYLLGIFAAHLKELQQQKNRLLGIAAHDLAGPAANILSFSELLFDGLKEKATDKEAFMLNRIVEISNYMGDMVNPKSPFFYQSLFNHHSY
jgi:signal transduction histidine kinase